MKKSLHTIALMLALLLPHATMAQKSRRPAQKAKAAVQKAPENPGLKLYRSLIPTTAKLMFIDSVVVSRAEMLRAIPMSADAGTISLRSTTKKGHGLAQYENGWGDTRIYAQGDTAAVRLYHQKLLGTGWGKATAVLDEFTEEYSFLNFPFLLSDGVTLYFSAESSDESMGGRDIFMTRYNTDEGTWYKPQNQGLPFNSTVNEYLLAIDDVDSLGWLVTDRRQPKDSVCIYTFVPTATRQDFSDDDLSDQEIERYSRILSIRDTWKFGDRKAALKRRDAMIARAKATLKNAKQEDLFVVNDQRVISSANQLSSERSRKLYTQLREVNNLLQQTSQQIDNKRAEYVDAQPVEMSRLAKEIAVLEKQREQQMADQKALSKQIRKEEQTN